MSLLSEARALCASSYTWDDVLQWFVVLQYLGSTVVTALEGTESTKASISQLKVTCIMHCNVCWLLSNWWVFVRFIAFSGLTLWLDVRKSIRPVKIEWWGVGVVVCLERGADCLHMVQLMPLHPLTPSSLASFKSILVLPFWYRLTQVVLEKRLLNGCISSSDEFLFFVLFYC